MINHESLKAFKVIRDPLSPNYIGYSFSVNDQREISYKDGSHHGKPGVVPKATEPQTPSLHGKPGVVPEATAPQTPSKPLRESDHHTGNDHEGHKDLSEEFRKGDHSRT